MGRLPCKTLPRKATLAGRHGKPTIVVDASFAVWLGNETEEKLTVHSQKLWGFNTGTFEYKIVSSGKLGPSGVPWRLLSDFSLMAISTQDRSKTLVPVCKHLHSLATRQGVADVEIRERKLAPKLQPAVP